MQQFKFDIFEQSNSTYLSNYYSILEKIGMHHQYTLELDCNPSEFERMLKHVVSPESFFNLPWLNKKYSDLIGEINENEFTVRLNSSVRRNNFSVRAHGITSFKNNIAEIAITISSENIFYTFIIILFITLLVLTLIIFFSLSAIVGLFFIGFSLLVGLIYYIITYSDIYNLKSQLNKDLRLIARKSLE